jgi:hypothetical protein
VSLAIRRGAAGHRSLEALLEGGEVGLRDTIGAPREPELVVLQLVAEQIASIRALVDVRPRYRTHGHTFLRKDEGVKGAQSEDAGEDGIARLEAGDSMTHLHHYTRQVAAQRGRQLKPEDRLHLPIPDFVINRVQSSRVDSNENFVRIGHWPENVSGRSLIWSAITFEGECFHIFLSEVFQVAADAL